MQNDEHTMVTKARTVNAPIDTFPAAESKDTPSNVIIIIIHVDLDNRLLTRCLKMYTHHAYNSHLDGQSIWSHLYKVYVVVLLVVS